MALSHGEDNLSEDEFYVGKLTLNEVKRRILWDKTRHNTACCEKENYKEFKLIETHSEPNLIHANDTSGISSNKSSYWDIRASDDSFLRVENMVEELCKSPDKTESKADLNNTLDVIDYILKHGPPDIKDTKNECTVDDKPCIISQGILDNRKAKLEQKKPISMMKTLSVKTVDNIDKRVSAYCNLTPTKTTYTDQKSIGFATPSSEIIQKPRLQLFKTPGPHSSQKKPSSSSLKIGSSKSKIYEHITSPVASYIKKTPQVPLMKDVHPKKPLSSSAIPKYLWNSMQPKALNTKNVKLPSIAYRSAKNTQVIDIPDEEKLPKSPWVNKITSTLPRPVVMKHDHREEKFTSRPLMPQQEDSFADLSYHQAELSVCTQKSAFKLKKHL